MSQMNASAADVTATTTTIIKRIIGNIYIS